MSTPRFVRTERETTLSLMSSDGDLLTPAEERATLQALGECKAKLAAALATIHPDENPTQGSDDPHAQAQSIAAFYLAQVQDPAYANLTGVYHRYAELRTKLALANMRLVAHVAKRFRDRGISYSDLIQDGFCGLLEAIDRFDVTHETKLATYATWWIRQAMQRAVAAGAYPVRLSPRHLRQLAQNQGELTGTSGVEGGKELIQRIHAATRPAVSLDVTLDGEKCYSLSHSLGDREADLSDDRERNEALGRMIDLLRPREQEVLSLRFGLGGKSRLSLSQVGKVLSVSKERVRQIQERALDKLRALAIEERMDETLLTS